MPLHGICPGVVYKRTRTVWLVLGVSAAVVAVVLAGTRWTTIQERIRPEGQHPEAVAEVPREAPVGKPLPANHSETAVRPITTADPVVTIWRHPGDYFIAGDLGRIPDPGLILVVWRDGRVVWSGDRVDGGPPFRAGRVDPKNVDALVDRFEWDGLFADKELKGVLGPGGTYLTILIRWGKQQIEMVSWHEVYEAGGRFVEDGLGVRSLNGRRRFEILRESKPDWLFYRFVWSETKGKLIDLIPPESTPTDGKPFMKDGELYWREPLASTKPDGAEGPPKK